MYNSDILIKIIERRLTMKLEIDTHSHTLASGHAYSTMKEMAKAGYKHGLKVLALTEHAPQMPGTCGLFYFQNLNVVPRNLCGIEVLLGTEANIMDVEGHVDLPDSVLSSLDIVIASLHMPCFKGNKGIEDNTKACLHAMQNPFINILGHPDDGRFPLDYEQLVLGAKQYGVLLEVNNSSLRPNSFRENAKENVRKMLQLCKKYQVPITVGSDAHVDADAGHMEAALEVIKACEFPKELIATTSLERLRPFLNRYKNK